MREPKDGDELSPYWLSVHPIGVLELNMRGGCHIERVGEPNYWHEGSYSRKVSGSEWKQTCPGVFYWIGLIGWEDSNVR